MNKDERLSACFLTSEGLVFPRPVFYAHAHLLCCVWRVFFLLFPLENTSRSNFIGVSKGER